jgi:hypothetical protein
MGKRHSPEQIVRMVHEAETKLAAGSSVPEIARELASARLRSTAGTHIPHVDLAS